MASPSVARARRRKAGALTAAVLFHLALLAAVGTVAPTFDLRFREEGPVDVSLLPPFEMPKRAPSPDAPPPPLRLHQPTAPVEPPRATPQPPPAPAGPPVPPAQGQTGSRLAASDLRFYERDLAGCGKEDLILMTPEELAACDARRALADAATRRAFQAEDRNLPPIPGIPADKRVEYESLLADRAAARSGRAQAELDTLQRNRGLQGGAVDVNVSARCSMTFGAGGDGLKLSRPNCPRLPGRR